jgi:hypothetical protein
MPALSPWLRLFDNYLQVLESCGHRVYLFGVGSIQLPAMLRQLLVAMLMLCVILLGSNAYALVCEWSCAAEAHHPQRDPEGSHSHHHSNAVSKSAHSHLQALQTQRKEDVAFLSEGGVPHPVAGCAAADRVTLNVQAIAQSNTATHSLAALEEGNVSLGRFMTHQTPSEFDSPPHSTTSQHSSTPLRI